MEKDFVIIQDEVERLASQIDGQFQLQMVIYHEDVPNNEIFITDKFGEFEEVSGFNEQAQNQVTDEQPRNAIKGKESNNIVIVEHEAFTGAFNLVLEFRNQKEK